MHTGFLSHKGKLSNCHLVWSILEFGHCFFSERYRTKKKKWNTLNQRWQQMLSILIATWVRKKHRADSIIGVYLCSSIIFRHKYTFESTQSPPPPAQNSNDIYICCVFSAFSDWHSTVGWLPLIFVRNIPPWLTLKSDRLCFDHRTQPPSFLFPDAGLGSLHPRLPMFSSTSCLRTPNQAFDYAPKCLFVVKGFNGLPADGGLARSGHCLDRFRQPGLAGQTGVRFPATYFFIAHAVFL